jgi:phage baseplate assembly protein W
MPDDAFRHLGTDLALTGYSGTPGLALMESADSWGTLDLRAKAALVSASVARPGPVAGSAALDIATVSGRENLAQALILRVLTPKGALAGLGHPDYGSRLSELIGRGNDATNRTFARLYTIEAIGQEARVARLEGLRVEAVQGAPDTIRIAFSVTPVGGGDPLNLSLDVAL